MGGLLALALTLLVACGPAAAPTAIRHAPSPSWCPTPPADRPTPSPALGGEDAGGAWTIRNHRECQRRRRQYRCRPCRACIARRLHAEHRAHANRRVQSGDIKLNYHPVEDLAPVSLIADTPIWIVSGKAVPADDLKSLIAWLKAQNGKATMGRWGSAAHRRRRAVLRQTHRHGVPIVPYTGGAPELTDLLGGHIDFVFGQAALQLTQVQSGQLKAFAVLQPNAGGRRPCPTLDELGIPDIDASFWHGIWVPQARRRTSSPSSMLPSAWPWPILACRSALRSWARRSGRRISRRPRLWRQNKKPKPPNGRQSSKRPCRRNNAIIRRPKEAHERTPKSLYRRQGL